MRKILLLLAVMLACIAANAATYTAYYTNPNGWSNVCAYAWSGTEQPLGEWSTASTTALQSKCYGTTRLWKVTFTSDKSATDFTIFFMNKDDTNSRTGQWTFYDGGVYTSSAASSGGVDPVATYGPEEYAVNLDDLNNAEGECVVFFQNTDNWSKPAIYTFIQTSESSATKLTGEWPGTEMTQLVTIDGTYYYTYTVTGVTADAYVMFADKSNESNKMAKTQLLHKGIYKPSGHVDGTGEVNYVGSHGNSGDTDSSGSTDDGTKSYTVYFQNTDNWNVPKIYAWTSNDDGTTTHHTGLWSGTQMTETVEIDGVTYYTYTVTGVTGSPQVIFSNNGSPQTEDLPLYDGGFYNCSGYVSHSNGSDEEDNAASDLSEYLVSGIPVLYINAYSDSTARDSQDHDSLTSEILDHNLSHKNYFSADYWIDLNGSSGLLNVKKNVGSEASPLPLDIKARGNFTRTGFAKKPFKLKLDKKQNLLGTSSKHYAILAHADDEHGFMRNYVGFALGKRIGLPWTSAECPIQVVINGNYRGLYFLTESIRMGDDRIPATAVDDNATNPTDLTGGYLVELDNYEEAGTSQITLEAKGSTGSTPLYITPDTPEEYSAVQTRFITNQFTMMNNYVGDKNDALWSYMDLDDAARYYIVNELVGHWEAYHGSTYLFRDKATTDTEGNITDNGKWHFSPLWDFGNAFATPESSSIVDEGQNHYGNTWIKGLRESSTFNDKVSATWKWFMQNQFGEMLSDIRSRAELIKEAAVKDKLRWPDNIKPTEGNSSGDYRSVVDNTNEAEKAEAVITYLTNRINSMKSWNGFGDYTSGSFSEPERDTTAAAELPEYVKAGYEAHETTYTVYFKDQDSPRIWIWDEGNVTDGKAAHYAGDTWDDRANMTSATDINGDTYYSYSFTTDEILSELTSLIITWGNGGDSERITASFVNGMLYCADGSTVADFDPDYFSVPTESTSADHNLSTDPVYIYVCDNAGWGRVDMWLYASGTNYSSAWPGQQLTKDESLYYGNYTGLYAFNATAANSGSTDFAKNGLVIFSNDGSSSQRYPGDNEKGLEVGGKSHIFFTADNSWVEVSEPIATYAPSYSLPILCIVTSNADEITQSTTKGAKFKFYNAADGFFTDANGDTNSAAVEGSIKGRGTSTWTDFNKKPYKIEFSAKQAFNGMPISKHWVLMPYAADQATGYIKNPLGHYLAKIVDTDNWHPDMTGVELVINGEYKGLYFVAENIRPAAERVQIKDIGDTGYSAEEDWILELDKYYTGTDYIHEWIDESSQCYMVAESPSVDDFAKVVKKGFATDVNEVTGYAQANAQAIQEAIDKAGDETVDSPTSSAKGYWDATWMELIDAQTAVNFYLIQELMDDADAYNTNLYLYHTSGSKWMFGPVWNFNSAFNSADSKNKRLTAEWAQKLYLNRYFRVRAINTLDKLAGIEKAASYGNEIAAGSVLSNVETFIDSYYEKYGKAIIADSKRWPGTTISAQSVALKAAPRAATVSLDEFDIEEFKETVNQQFEANATYLLNNGRDDNGGTTGAELVLDDLNAEAIYFNLQGIQIDKPVKGNVYIVRRGTTVAKEIAK